MPAFEKSQLVNVPGIGQQGRISCVMDFVHKPATYQVMWLDENMVARDDLFPEADLIAAQKKKPDATLKVDVDSSALQAATAEVEKMAAAARDCEATINRIPRNVLNLGKRASARRSKRK